MADDEELIAADAGGEIVGALVGGVRPTETGNHLVAGSVEWDSPEDRWNVLDFCYVELAGKDRQHLVLESEVARY